MKRCRLALGSRIDRYVARLFALSYLAAFFLIVGLFLIMDMAANLEDYLAPDDQGNTPPSFLVGKYYLLQLPFLYLQMSPYVTLVAGMFTATKLARNNEIVAVLNMGLSTRRLLLTVYLGAVLLALGMFGLRELATRELGLHRDLLHDRLREQRPELVIENLWVHDQRGRPVRLREFRLGSETNAAEARGLSYRYREGDLSVSTAADVANPLADGRWSLIGGRRLEWDALGRRSIAVRVLEDVRFSLEDVVLAWKGREHPLDLSFSETHSLLERDPTNDQYRTLLQYQFTFPLAGVVLLLVGLPFLVGQERGRAGERIARGFFLCVAYFGIDFIARTLGLQGQVGPLYAAWFPLVFFGSLGAVLTASMRS